MASGRRQYPFDLVEPKWQRHWEAQQTFRAWNPGEAVPPQHPFAARHAPARPEQLPKFYILDMFPYPSGAGLHVGHPEGYTATDILARYRRARGEHVLHPMGWDAFGLPAEQYAIKTGQHPRQTTEDNIANFKRQIKALGFSYDWSREVDTTDPQYFRWTQWIFLQFYHAWFNPATNRAEPITTLVYPPELKPAAGTPDPRLDARRRAYRDAKRLAYVSEAPVWWCEQLGTVLANEEVVDGKSEVGGFPVIRKPMRQWMLRITAYAERLLRGLDTIDWSDSLKEMQRNWIGRSEGAEVDFAVAAGRAPGANYPSSIRVFTTRPDTLFGATYMVLAPEYMFLEAWLGHGIVPAQWPSGTPPAWTGGAPTPRAALEEYRRFAARKSDLERTELAKEKSGVFTGVHALNPVNGQQIPIWIADYVLASYGTGAIMAVPGHDTRDFEFAQKFGLPIVQVVQPPAGKDWRGYVDDGVAVNSANAEIALDGLPTPEAKRKITAWLEARHLGCKTINYKLRDWLFSRQRYWGEPFPILWKTGPDGQPYHEALPESDLPLLPPPLDDYKPTPDGQPPLARARDWVSLPDGATRETNTMPQWAGSCWYYLRFLDAHNDQRFVDKSAERYWMGYANLRVPSTVDDANAAKARAAGDAAVGAPPGTSNDDRRNETIRQLLPQAKPPTAGVDLYVGGTEHAVLHLLYARFWHKVLYDLGYVSTPEPFYRLVNQGLILGEMEFTAFAFADGRPCTVADLRDVEEEASAQGRRLVGYHKQTGEKLFGRRVPEDEVVKAGEGFSLKTNHQLRVDARSFKMSKSRGNVINPDDILDEYGADAFRLYEMFLGPLEMVKPWSTKGVEGGYRFLGRVWRLFIDEASQTEFEQNVTAEPQRAAEFLEQVRLSPVIRPSEPTSAQLKALHACIKKVTEDLDGLRFNTAISALMVFINEALVWETRPAALLRDFLILLQPFAPHLAEELWSRLHADARSPAAALSYAPWPAFDPARLVEDILEIPVQVNGKLRAVIQLPVNASPADLEAAARASEKVKPFVAGKTVRKVIVLPRKLVNIVVG